MAYESREEIDSKYKWDLSSMFPSDEAFEAGLEELKAYCPKLLECGPTQDAVSIHQQRNK